MWEPLTISRIWIPIVLTTLIHLIWVTTTKRSKKEYVVIDSFGGVQIPQEVLSKSKIESKASLTSDRTKISLNKILKRKTND